jgi:site-specific recombinase XerD
MNNSIKISEIYHNSRWYLGISFPYDEELIALIRQLPSRKYSKTLRSWLLPLDDSSLHELNKLNIETVWSKKPTQLKIGSETKVVQKIIPHSKKQKLKKITIDPYWLDRIDQFEKYLLQKRYSQKTIDSYLNILKLFFGWWKNRPLQELCIEEANAFNYEYFILGKHSRSYQNIWVSALKLYLDKFSDVNIDLKQLERPMASKTLPNVLSENEVKRLINSFRNIKHKAIIMTFYACGLRKSELINLKIKEIDSGRGLIRIRNSKGAKDRDVALPKSLLMLLRVYYIKYQPKEYLFNGQNSLQYSGSSIDKIIKRGLKRAGIKKYITAHGLRHSYATHLVEHNINLRFIQDSLGHKSSKTTEIYTKLSKENISSMPSPIDFWEEK